MSVPQDDPIRHIDKTRQDALPVSLRPRVNAWEQRQRAWIDQHLPAIISRVARVESFLTAGSYGLRHINAYIRYTKAV
jgi:hypothetical protein